jgi:flagellar basal-body rod protein FlgB
MATSDPAHVADTTAGPERVEEAEDDDWQTYDSGNTVSIEKELVKAGEVNSAFALNNSVVKTFHRMLLASAKG